MKSSGIIKAGVVALCVLALPGLSLADSDECKKVRFRVTNEHVNHKKILITSVSYFDIVNNKKVTKGLKNFECNYQQTCLTSEKDLVDVEGNDIKNIKFEYKKKEGDGDWSDPLQTKAFDPENNAECKADRIYGPPPKGFVIQGT